MAKYRSGVAGYYDDLGGFMRLLRLIRGALGTAATWAVVWSAIAVLLRLVRTLTAGREVSLQELLVDHLIPAWQYGFFYGSVLGASFALLLFLLGSKARSLHNLSMRGVGIAGAAVACGLHWWVIGGPALDPYLVISLALGAGSGTGTLAMAWRAERLISSAAYARLPMTAPNTDI